MVQNFLHTKAVYKSLIQLALIVQQNFLNLTRHLYNIVIK